MQKIISEIQIIPVKANKGLVAFTNFILFESFFCSSVGVFTRPEGGFRLVYPTKKLGTKQFSIFHPINIEISSMIESEVTKEVEKLLPN